MHLGQGTGRLVNAAASGVLARSGQPHWNHNHGGEGRSAWGCHRTGAGDWSRLRFWTKSFHLKWHKPMKWEVSLAVAMIMLAVRAPSPGGGEETTAQLRLTAFVACQRFTSAYPPLILSVTSMPSIIRAVLNMPSSPAHTPVEHIARRAWDQIAA